MSYRLCGLRLVSALPLPELPPWQGDDRAPDIEISLGAVPEMPPDAVGARVPATILADGTCCFGIARIALFRLAAGRHVVVQPCPGADPTDIRVYLLGSVVGILCYQRGLLPLHAGCVAIGGRAIAFTGDFGEGKSTLMAAFLRAGHPLLADDVTVVATGGEGGPLVLPSVPRIKLKHDAAAALGIPARDMLLSTGVEQEKAHLAVGDRFQATPLPLAAVYHLSSAATAGIRVEGLHGVTAVDLMMRAVYRRPLLLRLGGAATMLGAAMRVLVRPSCRLVRPRDLGAIDATVAAVTARHGDPFQDRS